MSQFRILSRRGFLRCAGLGAAAVAMPAYANLENRSLKFVHTHTGETLTAAYLQAGAYVPDALTRINRVLRDFRTGSVCAIDPSLLDTLYELQVLANRDDPFQIICGYRSPETNLQLRKKSSGVAKHSLHMEGRAIDVRLGSFATDKLRDLAMQLKRGGVGFYADSNFVHLDTGRVRYW